MTGPEHYAAAEKLLSRPDTDPDQTPVPASLVRAQVHATLAQAAAAALGDRDFRAWLEVAGPSRPEP